jgi:hypothetical protein
MKVRSRIFFFTLLFLLTASLFAQKHAPVDPMKKDTWTINFGFGPGVNFFEGYHSGFGPGFQASFEKGMWQLGPGVLTLGAETGVSYFSYDGELYTNATYNYHWLSIITAARASYHYGWKVKGLDTYGGFSTGMRFLAFSDDYSDIYPDPLQDDYNPNLVSVFFGTYVGASYFFNDRIGINGEFGYNINYAQIGLIFKLN